MSFLKKVTKLFSQRPTPNRVFLSRISAGTLPNPQVRASAEREVKEQEDKLRYTEHDVEDGK